jgi:tRNA uridine 5-carboxymethylaminomethyl modification enzyme
MRPTTHPPPQQDDLITLGAREPYRMFTSRSEFRLSVRSENADFRLTRRGYEAGIVGRERYEYFTERERLVGAGLSALAGFVLPSSRWAALGYKVAGDGRPRSGDDILSMPHVTLAEISALMHAEGRAHTQAASASHEEADAGAGTGAPRQQHLDVAQAATDAATDAVATATTASLLPPPPVVHPRVAEHVEVAVKYRGYLQRQAREVEEYKGGASGVALPGDMVYAALPGLSKEEQEILEAHRPPTVYAASRIPGIRPSTTLLLYQSVKRLAAAAARSAGGGGDGARRQAALLRAEAAALAEERARDGSLPAGAA